MSKVTRILKMALISGTYLCFSSLAYAHTMWLNATDYSPESYPGYGARSIAYFGWGHHYPADGFLTDEFLGEFSLIDPDGRKGDLSPNPGGFRATEVKFKEKGGWIIASTIKPGFYTMYMEKGKMHHKIGPKTGLKGVILSFYYEQYAKALINVGEAKDDFFCQTGRT